MEKEVAQWGEWFDYSAITVAHDGTILLMYKTTANMSGLPASIKECCSMALARFDLDWLDLPGIAFKTIEKRLSSMNS
jgi:hypothetical protein